MSVSTTALEVRYTGNGSTVTPYPIPFPFLDSGHIFAAVSSDGVADPVLLSESGYIVTRADDSSGGSLVTTAAVTSPAKLVIFRELPLTQPTAFQAAGPFPAKSSELALDRLLMQVQQLNARITALSEDVNPSVSGDGGRGMATWPAAEDRGATKPAFAGQLGVERFSQTVWIGQSTAAGDWKEFRPNRTNRVTLGFCSDGAIDLSFQDSASARFSEWDVDGVILTGGVNPGLVDDIGFAADPTYGSFPTWIADGTAYPALGAHDMDQADWEDLHAAKFPYLPGNKRYYSVVLGGGMLELFVLNSGFDSARDVVEPDGNEVGSVQHQWFVSALAASTARWRVAVFHVPPVTTAADFGVTATEMAWPELEQMHLILCSMPQVAELIRWRDTMIANAPLLLFASEIDPGGLVGDFTSTDQILYSSKTDSTIGRLVASGDRLEVEIWKAEGGRLLSRSITNFTLPYSAYLVARAAGGTTGIQLFHGDGPTRHYILAPASTTDRVLTLPDVSGTFLLEGNTATVTGKTISGASNTLTNIGPGSLVNFPKFSAWRSTALSIAYNVWTKVVCQTEEFDTANCYDTSTGRFTPTVAGYYSFTFGFNIYPAQSGVQYNGALYKNGAAYKSTACGIATAGGTPALVGTVICFMNGTTDYVEPFAKHEYSSGTQDIPGWAAEFTYFQGARLP